MNAQEWLSAFAASLEIEAPDEETIDELLELAAIAAHSSERTAAPIACYMVGLSGLSSGDALGLAHDVSEES